MVIIQHVLPRHTWTGSQMSFPSEFWHGLWSEIIKHTALWDQLRLWAHGPSWKINLHLQIQLGLSLVRKGLNLPPSPTCKKNDRAGFRVGDQTKQVHYRDEANCSTASIIHPSAISSLCPDSRGNLLEFSETKQSASPLALIDNPGILCSRPGCDLGAAAWFHYGCAGTGKTKRRWG